MDTEKLRSFLKRLEEGIETPQGLILLKKKTPGRFREEFNLEIALGNEHLLYIKVFQGRGNIYKDWIEVFGINPGFFGTPVEDTLIETLGELTGRLFIEYFEDRETTEELSKGVPPALSRLGFLLLNRGYTYFRDWYIPEGLMEGGHKLQAEKPTDKEALKKHLLGLKRELEAWKEKHKDKKLMDRVLDRFEKAQTIFVNL